MKWLVGVLTGMVVTIGLPVLLADLNDSDVCRWLAKQLIRRAARRLPRRDRPRWEEEWLRHSNDVPGRLLPLGRALLIFFRAGSWGRMLRGLPPVSQMLRAQVRAAWQNLRSRPKSPSVGQEPQPPTAKVELQPAIMTVEAAPVIPALYPGDFTSSWPQASKPGLSDREFERYLRKREQEFEEYLARWQRRVAQQIQENQDWVARRCTPAKPDYQLLQRLWS